MAILELKHVSKFFGGLAANADISFSLQEGMIKGLIGPNGAGKTTLFNCITGYYPPSRGDVLFKGQRITSFAGHTQGEAGWSAHREHDPKIRSGQGDFPGYLGTPLFLSINSGKEAMNPTSFTVSPDMDIIDAAQLLHDKKLYALCVVDEYGHLAGILTITDILEAFIAICKNPLTAAQ